MRRLETLLGKRRVVPGAEWLPLPQPQLGCVRRHPQLECARRHPVLEYGRQQALEYGRQLTL